MLPKNCGKLLYDAVRETLETMAFADVVPCSIKVAGEEFAHEDDFFVASGAAPPANSGWGDDADTWGTAAPSTVDGNAAAPDESWGDSPKPTSPADCALEDDVPLQDEDDWGKSGVIAPPVDPWGEASLTEQAATAHSKPKEADFDYMITEQTDWCWACMKVNSPDVHSVWLIVSNSLAQALAQNMYAGEITNLDTPIIRDLIAELTNVLGGRLMLLLEELGGKFTLMVPDIGFGMPEIPETDTLKNVICKVVVDGEHPIIVALCFNPGGLLSE